MERQAGALASLEEAEAAHAQEARAAAEAKAAKDVDQLRATLDGEVRTLTPTPRCRASPMRCMHAVQRTVCCPPSVRPEP